MKYYYSFFCQIWLSLFDEQIYTYIFEKSVFDSVRYFLVDPPPYLLSYVSLRPIILSLTEHKRYWRETKSIRIWKQSVTKDYPVKSFLTMSKTKPKQNRCFIVFIVTTFFGWKENPKIYEKP